MNISADPSACGVLHWIRFVSKSEVERSETEAKRKAKRSETTRKRKRKRSEKRSVAQRTD